MTHPTATRTRRALAQLVLLVLFVLSALSGCNTFEGLGKDLQSLGGSISDKAEDASD